MRCDVGCCAASVSEVIWKSGMDLTALSAERLYVPHKTADMLLRPDA
jgi:hypothetical protein